MSTVGTIILIVAIVILLGCGIWTLCVSCSLCKTMDPKETHNNNIQTNQTQYTYSQAYALGTPPRPFPVQTPIYNPAPIYQPNLPSPQPPIYRPELYPQMYQGPVYSALPVQVAPQNQYYRPGPSQPAVVSPAPMYIPNQPNISQQNVMPNKVFFYRFEVTFLHRT